MRRWAVASLLLVVALILLREWRGLRPASSTEPPPSTRELFVASAPSAEPALSPQTSGPSSPTVAPQAEPSAPPPQPPAMADPLAEAATPPQKPTRLGGPMPRSVRELRAKLTPYQMPLSARGIGVDGLIANAFCGYIEEGGTYRELIVDRSMEGVNSVKQVILQEKDGTQKKWSGQADGLRVKSFDGDRYSLVLELPNQQMLYLKHSPFEWVQSLQGSFRPMRGWLLPGTARVALIDCVHGALDSPPTPLQLAPLLPEPLPLALKDDDLEK